jgi:hypothetical protein
VTLIIQLLCTADVIKTTHTKQQHEVISFLWAEGITDMEIYHTPSAQHVNSVSP